MIMEKHSSQRELTKDFHDELVQQLRNADVAWMVCVERWIMMENFAALDNYSMEEFASTRKQTLSSLYSFVRHESFATC